MKVNKDNLVFFQGRCFPENYRKYNEFPRAWKKEIRTVGKMGFKYIDLIYDKRDSLFEKLDKIIFFCKKTKIKINSVICDKFLNRRYAKSKKLFLKEIEFTINFLERKKIFSITLPFIEKNYLNYKDLIYILNKLYLIIKKKKIVIYFEYNHSFDKLKKDLRKFKNKILLCYDTGNALENKRNIYSDLIKLQNIIGHVHLKDKKKTYNGFKKIKFSNGEFKVNKFRQNLKYFKNTHCKFTLETYMGKNPYLNLKNNFELLNSE